jgi:hypothetical protein
VTTRRRLLLAAVAALIAVVVVVLATRPGEKHGTALPPGAATAVAVGANGKVVVGGQGFVGHGSDVARVQGTVAAVPPTGLAAATVFSDGRYVPELVPGARKPVGDGDALARGVADVPGGGAVLVADATRSGRRVVAVMRYDGSGHRLGTTFIGMRDRSLSAAGVAVTRTGAIVVAGAAYDSSGSSDVFVARAGGAPRILPSGADGTVARALALDSSGRAVIAASGRRGGRSKFIALRATPGGALDPAFGTRGMAIVPGAEEAFATGVAVDEHGWIVLAGRIDARGTLVRLTPSGQVDHAFRSPPLPNGPQLSVAADPRGGLLVVGTRIARPRERVAIARVR